MADAYPIGIDEGQGMPERSGAPHSPTRIEARALGAAIRRGWPLSRENEERACQVAEDLMSCKNIRLRRAGAQLALRIADHNLRIGAQELEDRKLQKRIADGDTSKPISVNVVNVQNLIKQALPNLSDAELQALIAQAQAENREPRPEGSAGG